MFSLALAWGWRADNPAKGVPRYQEIKRDRWLSDDALRRLWRALEARADNPAAGALMLQLLIGARLVEGLIARRGAASGHLFPGRVEGKPLRDVKRFWTSVCAEAGLEDYRRHDNRHTFASHLVSSGLSLEIVGRLLGHTSAETTKRYAHLADEPLRAAAERFGGKWFEMESEAGLSA